MGVEFVFSPSGKAIRLVVFSKKNWISRRQTRGRRQKMYISEFRNPYPSIYSIGAITSKGPRLETHEHISHSPSLKRLI